MRLDFRWKIGPNSPSKSAANVLERPRVFFDLDMSPASTPFIFDRILRHGSPPAGSHITAKRVVAHAERAGHFGLGQGRRRPQTR